MADSLPLLTRHPDEIIAIRGDRPIACREFLAQVAVLADSLPDMPMAVNLCEDRYLFMLAFAAVVVRGHANLLLPSRQPAAIAEVFAGIGDCYYLHDGQFADLVAEGLDVRAFDKNLPAADRPVPMIPANQLSAVIFTSGTTGESTRVEKFWRTLVVGTSANARYALDGFDQPVGVVATVPPWHMYGLEYSILLPLFSDVRSYTGNTLFPADIKMGLERTSVDRMLVATPLHLRAIARSGLTFPPVARVLCATAPLSQELAIDVTDLLTTDICEFYGCTEVGSLAYRNPVTASEWTFFDEFSIESTADRVCLTANHLPESVTLTDDLRFTIDGRFVLQGRAADLVKIGGKRGSLADLTQRLLRIDGVEDGVVFSPKPDGNGNEARVAGFAVCPGRDINHVREELAAIVDPVFLPRPLVKVDALPRNRTGKLRKLDLQRLFKQRVK